MMKNRYLTIGITIMITAAIMSGCNNDDKKPVVTEEVSEVQEKVSEVCTNCDEEAMSTLRAATIHNMVNNYRQSQLQPNIAGTERDDTHSIWFDLEKLKTFICQVETAVGEIESEKLGLRIYYASYPLKSEFNNEKFGVDFDGFDGPLKKQYEKRHTLVMIPTIKNDNGLNLDFNPLDPNTYDAGLMGPQGLGAGIGIGAYSQAYRYGPNSSLKTSAFGFTFNNGGDNDDTGAQNHGQLIPPGNPLQQGF